MIAVAPAEPPPAPVLPLRGLPPLPPQAVQGGECVEAELFWAHTRLSVWQLAPGEQLVAGTAPECDVLLEGVQRAAVLRCDANGWMVSAPRPLTLTLIEDGRSLGGPELLVRGRSQADAQGLVLPLPQKGVAVLGSGTLALRSTAIRVSAGASMDASRSPLMPQSAVWPLLLNSAGSSVE